LLPHVITLGRFSHSFSLYSWSFALISPYPCYSWERVSLLLMVLCFSVPSQYVCQQFSLSRLAIRTPLPSPHFFFLFPPNDTTSPSPFSSYRLNACPNYRSVYFPSTINTPFTLTFITIYSLLSQLFISSFPPLFLHSQKKHYCSSLPSLTPSNFLFPLPY